MRPSLLLPLLAVALGSAAAQPAVVAGTVRDADGTPLPGASVYLSGTTRGTSADAGGRFRLEAVPPGAYRVVGSMVGFAPDVRELRLAPGAQAAVDLSLAPATRTLGDVGVEAERDGRWARRLAWFEKALLGESANADSTHVLNPEVLDLRVRWGELRAEATAPLVIENRALGYRLTYDLHAFRASATSVRYDGDEHFEAMAPASPAQAERWAAARARAYRGSLAHLLQSLLVGTAEAEGYSFEIAREDTYGAWRTVRAPTRWLMDVDADGWGTLRVRGRLDVTYAGEPEEPAYLRSEWFREPRRRPDSAQRSSLTVDRGRARVDPQGTPEDPFSISTSGHQAFERLADRVPEDYRPPPDL
ncbi:carboxypeptidase-like regulatory domain-containing protein [Rubrivirga sp.]|uniref:carboxypeptidase-like regulatory domain-containing protein n=1 Tax=Rubrivirga sp. TaxID=1885344 RepID=UPI003B52E02B